MSLICVHSGISLEDKGGKLDLGDICCSNEGGVTLLLVNCWDDTTGVSFLSELLGVPKKKIIYK